jgi:putative Mn2+ efflux pump MntP
MSPIELVLIALGLSADAFAISITNGMGYKPKMKNTLLIAGSFGIFQGLMPVLGYLLGSGFAEYIEKYDHWVAFILLGIIGGKMMIESVDKKEKDTVSSLTLKLILIQGIATSIDAFAVGVSFATLKANIILSAVLITVITFICSFIGVFIGKKSGDFLGSKAEFVGGLILVGIGAKILFTAIFSALG